MRPKDEPVLRIGLLADPHYADKSDNENRCYRGSLDKVRQAVEHFNRAKADFAVELGDFIDSGDSIEQETAFVRRIETEFARFGGARYHVLGNHCVEMLTKNEFLRACRTRRPAYYSFDVRGFHFIVLDACYRRDEQPYGRRNFTWTDACIPAAECGWLREDLAQTQHRSIVFVHQRLDTDDKLAIANRQQVRDILERSGKVLAVVQGHHHPGDCRKVGPVHYVTLTAMVTRAGLENNAYGILEVYSDGTLRLQGFGRQKSFMLPPASAGPVTASGPGL